MSTEPKATESKAPEAGITLTPEMLERIIATAIAAAKAPNAVEQAALDQQTKEIAAKQKYRKQTADSVKQDAENKKWAQQHCSHEHSNGQSHCVYVQEKVGPGYMLCQLNQCIIRPGEAGPNYKGSVIYNTDQFNRLFQKLNSTEIFG